MDIYSKIYIYFIIQIYFTSFTFPRCTNNNNYWKAIKPIIPVFCKINIKVDINQWPAGIENY